MLGLNIALLHRTAASSSSRNCYGTALCARLLLVLVFFTLNLPTGSLLSACDTTAAAARSVHLYDRPICGIAKDFRRSLLNVFDLFDCQQPTVHCKTPQRGQINVLLVIKRLTIEELLDLVCQLGGGIHTQEARETIDHLAEEHASCCTWQIGRTTSDQRLHPLVTDSTCFRKRTPTTLNKPDAHNARN